VNSPRGFNSRWAGSFKCVHQLTCWKWFAQTRDAAGLKGLLMHSFIIESGHEDDRKLWAVRFQLLQELNPGDIPEVNIQKNAIDMVCRDSAEKFFGR